MRRLVALLLLVALAPAPAAQSAADSALVARIYADLTRGDVPAVVAVLDDHVLWTEHAEDGETVEHFGPGTVAARVLRPMAAPATVDVPERITAHRGGVVAVGLTRRHDPETGHLVVTHFRHEWQVLYGRVMRVDRSAVGPALQTADP